MTTNRASKFPIILILFGSLIQAGHGWTRESLSGWTDYTPWSTPFRQIEKDKISKIYPTNHGFKTNFGKHNGNLVRGLTEKWMRAHLGGFQLQNLIINHVTCYKFDSPLIG